MFVNKLTLVLGGFYCYSTSTSEAKVKKSVAFKIE